jgi:hypothetical protein
MKIIYYDTTSKIIRQIIEEESPLLKGEKMLCCKTAFIEDIIEEIETDNNGDIEKLSILINQVISQDLEELRKMSLDHVGHKFVSNREVFISNGESFSSEPETRGFIIALVVSANESIANNTAWTTGRFDKKGNKHTFDAKEFILHVKDMELSINNLYIKYQKDIALVKTATDTKTLFKIIEG